ncbi:small serum protein 5-like isoform X1 [Sphaerodactylus townsendi]|uniref:small serum protein 5-like isoform X1 n=1 Tax=Sphaerodactylus townsendi TaxID=933632 RepID=UPI002026C8C6|nr:small serum protein 5-like isoform X1 [Sphaerodactylus townsendi]
MSLYRGPLDELTVKKVFLILTISYITLAMCHGACFQSAPELAIKDGQLVKPDSCVDPQDESKHALGSSWNSTNCMGCNCNDEGEVQCCSRYGGLAVVEGCKGVVDPETCEYKFYKADDPSAPCPGF